MPRGVIFLVIAAGFLVATGRAEVPEPAARRYGIESGIVTYEAEGAYQGTQTVYFDTWGLREARYADAFTNLSGKEEESHVLTLRRDNWIYVIDMKERTGSKWRVPEFTGFSEGDGGRPPKGWQVGEFSQSALKRMGAAPAGEETYLGHTCKVWNIPVPVSTVCVWEDIPLKVETKIRGHAMVVKATSLQVGGNVPEEKFSLPQDIKITEKNIGGGGGT